MKTILLLLTFSLLTSCASNQAQMDAPETSPYAPHQSTASLDAAKMVRPVVGY